MCYNNAMKSVLVILLVGAACSLWGQAPFVRPQKRAPGTRPATVQEALGAQGLSVPGLDAIVDTLHTAADQFGRNGLPAIDFQAIAAALRLSPFTANEWGRKRTDGATSSRINLTPAEMLDVARLAFAAVQIANNAQRRQAQHNRALAAQGLAEEPASTAACRFNLDLGANGRLTFDCWGEVQLDRRFLTPADLAVIQRLEAYYRKAFGASAYARTAQPPPPPGTDDAIMYAAADLVPRTRPQEIQRRAVPIFRGFEDARYQQHDALIVRLTKEFNAHKADWIGGTTNQSAKIANLSPALVKAQMIEETGGNGPMSRAAWPVDPQQVNVPGDWTDYKADLGLVKPAKRNEGTAEGNVRAAIKFLARKGFGKSGQPTRNRPEGFFDGWSVALQRYNARRDRTFDNRAYSDAYSDKIRQRANNPNTFVPISIKLAPPPATPAAK